MVCVSSYWKTGICLLALLPMPALAQDESEIVVTAQKRAERAIDVPGALTAIDGDRLAALGVAGTQDLAALAPGLTLAGTNRAASTLILRGITTSSMAASASVGVVVDGIPAGSSSSFALGGAVPLDINPFDLERVEVLRGPQGTLYGASTLGGLLSYVTKAPSLTATDGAVGLSTQVAEGGGWGFAARAAVSTPLAPDVAGIRLSGFYDRLPGYLDNSVLGAKNVNRNNSYGGRAALRLKPAETLSVTLAAQAQVLNRRSNDAVPYDFATGRPVAGERDQALPNFEPYHQRFRLFSAHVDWDLGGVTLTAQSSWQRIRSANNYDYSLTPLGMGVIGLGGGAIAGARLPFSATTHKFVQEVRLSSSEGGPLRWLIGAFHTDEDSFLDQRVIGYGADLKPALDALVFAVPTSLREDALFANLSYALNDRLTIGGGLRYSDSHQRFAETVSGPMAPVLGIEGAFPAVRSSEDVLTYSASIQYRVGDAANLYARAASGYRPGGPNLVLPGIAPRFKADRLDNYEVGYKARFADGMGSIDIAAFYIDYRDIQLTGSLGGLLYFTNGKSATSKGIEASASFAPTPGLSLAVNAAYTDAALNAAVPELEARKGERLPATPRFAGSVNADYRWAAGGGVEAFGRAALRYIGRRPVSFDASTTSPQFMMKAAALVDLRAGIEQGGYEIALQVTNLFDAQAQMYGTTTYGHANISIAQPRSYGLSVTKRF